MVIKFFNGERSMTFMAPSGTTISRLIDEAVHHFELRASNPALVMGDIWLHPQATLEDYGISSGYELILTWTATAASNSTSPQRRMPGGGEAAGKLGSSTWRKLWYVVMCALAMTAAGAPESDTPMQLAGDGGSPESAGPGVVLMNLNLASVSDLQKCPGIGPKTAAKLKTRHFNDWKEVESMYGVQKWQLYNLKDFYELNGTTRSKRTRASMSVEHENESVVSQRVPCGIMPYTPQPSPWLKTDT